MTPLRGDDAGFSLVETLVSLVVLSLAVVTIVTALGTSARSTAIQGAQADADLALRNAAEHVRGVTYEACPDAPTYSVSAAGAPTGTTVVVTSVEHWDGDEFVGSCPAEDAGFQRVTLTSTGNGGEVVRTLQVVKRRP